MALHGIFQELKLNDKPVETEDPDFNIPDKTDDTSKEDNQPDENDDASKDDTKENTDDDFDDYTKDTDDDSSNNIDDTSKEDTKEDTDKDFDDFTHDEDTNNDKSDETDTDIDQSSSNNNEDTNDDNLQSDDELKQLDQELFKNLSPEQIVMKNKKLKLHFLDLFEETSNIIERIGDVNSREDMSSCLEFISDKLDELRNMIVDYIENIYDSKSYMENAIYYNQCLVVLSGINKILAEFNKKEDK